MNRLSAWLSLFTSTSTLLCCALPSLLVTLGLGATMAGLISVFPQLIWLSQHKEIVFIGSGTLLAFSIYLQYQSQNKPCPLDPKLAQTCRSSRRLSLFILIFSIIIWLIGAFFAFLAPHIL